MKSENRAGTRINRMLAPFHQNQELIRKQALKF
ncbi:hypothetical protein BAE44_0021346 [Dichanthelium oligosanthes]|uniref:Uncharacterized protein n=1 Tax=Dichanthelium oligosanthes TaxID=888268 RepID=A0A1E5UXN0_9POAL|nr:hypothetical protein BAE44_0021346 [Dichanthelium oligosanthes]